MEHGQFVDNCSCYPCKCTPGYGHQSLGISYSLRSLGINNHYIWLYGGIGFYTCLSQLLVSCMNLTISILYYGRSSIIQQKYIAKVSQNYCRTIYHLARSPTYWITILLIIVVGLLPRFTCKVVCQIFWPSDIQIAREAELMRKQHDRVQSRQQVSS